LSAADLAERLAPLVAAAAAHARPLVVGLTGPQGSGKSTLAARLPDLLAAAGLNAGVLALDDLYLTKAERQRLAADVHPLFATRGVPGTHDVACWGAWRRRAKAASPASTRAPTIGCRPRTGRASEAHST
jgi:pantothenate kinase-related protein Tda10